MTKTIPEKPRTFHGNLEQLPDALLPLTNFRLWVVWKWEYVENKAYWTKVPYQPRYFNEKAKSDDARTWGTYAEAISA
jgi:primase-polymerase (primpol)-like protein